MTSQSPSVSSPEPCKTKGKKEKSPKQKQTLLLPISINDPLIGTFPDNGLEFLRAEFSDVEKRKTFLKGYHKPPSPFPVLLHPEIYPQNTSRESPILQTVYCITMNSTLTSANLSSQPLGITLLKHYLKTGPAFSFLLITQPSRQLLTTDQLDYFSALSSKSSGPASLTWFISFIP